MAHDFGGARILGAHIEGPYLAAAKCGAQPAGHLREPNPAEYLPWLDREGLVTQMTLAPELPGALVLIDALLEREIIPSAGHTAATHEQTRAAIERGLYQATHLFNCMSAAGKHGALRVPGALETLLADERVMVELIADGHHVHRELLKLAWRAKGTDHVSLVTDATAGAGLAEGAEFQVGQTRGLVRGGVGMLPDESALVGSVAPMIALVRTMVKQVGVPLADVVRMASLSPARALGISGHKGSLEPRKDADVVVFTEDFHVQKTFVGGRLEYAAG
jgi:N-acetylglucosamine-6-phosphate deacetylase